MENKINLKNKKDEKIITFKLTLKTPNLKFVNGIVKIKDGIAISVFDDEKLAFKLYQLEKKNRNKNVDYNASLKAYIERYPNKTADEIAIIIGDELKSQGGRLKDVRTI